MLNPRESGEFIVKNAKYLAVEKSGIERLTKEVIKALASKQIDVENFSQHPFHPISTDPNACNHIFLIDTLNFCFWTKENATKWQVDAQTGYFALCASIMRSIKNNIDITNPKYYVNITEAELSEILKSDDGITPCPLLKERVQCLHEVGQKLIDKYDGNFENCIKAAKQSAVSLLELVVKDFPCFRDEAVYMGQNISIYKRAQILIGDLWACYRAEGLGFFEDINKITMFADYRVPQVLVHFGTLKYSEELLKMLREDTLLENGSPQEVEIRGASIYIVEQLKDNVLKELLTVDHPGISQTNVNSILLDHFLWDYRRRFAVELEQIPFHKTISIFY